MQRFIYTGWTAVRVFIAEARANGQPVRKRCRRVPAVRFLQGPESPFVLDSQDPQRVKGQVVYTHQVDLCQMLDVGQGGALLVG